MAKQSNLPMDPLDYWRLCDQLSIIQAALLIAGCDPSVNAAYIEHWEVEKRPPAYEAAKAAIVGALRWGDIKGEVVHHEGDGSQSEIARSIDLCRSCVDVAALKKWLAARGIKSGSFFPRVGDTPDYLNSSHPRYAPKLAAAVNAWLAVQSESLLGTSPKKALTKWLQENAADYDLSDKNGKPIEQGIDDAAKVANWQPGGGAPKTPGG